MPEKAAMVSVQTMTEETITTNEAMTNTDEDHLRKKYVMQYIQSS